MDYTSYKTEDFITDEYFIQWVKQPSEENTAFWAAWLSKHPEQEKIIHAARQIVLMLDFKMVKPPKGKSLEIWQKINQADSQRTMSISMEQKPPIARRWYALAAACLLVAIGASIYSFLPLHEEIIIQTEYAELRSLLLPDSTKVVLNANSQLRYKQDFKRSREVWIVGEAFFIVKRKHDDQNFRVHTEDVQVEVLGTRFNVNTRRGKSQVVLEEGKVVLNVEAIQDAPMEMLPGDFIELDKKTRRIERKHVDVDNYSAWRSNRLVFVGTTLGEIAQQLEDNYGYEVVFENETIKENTFTGSASVDNLDELLDKMERVFNLRLTREGKKLVIETK